jgi:hypothetical protein
MTLLLSLAQWGEGASPFFVTTGLDPVVHAEVQREKTMPRILSSVAPPSFSPLPIGER